MIERYQKKVTVAGERKSAGEFLSGLFAGDVGLKHPDRHEAVFDQEAASADAKKAGLGCLLIAVALPLLPAVLLYLIARDIQDFRSDKS